jgi:hypothetical protein
MELKMQIFLETFLIVPALSLLMILILHVQSLCYTTAFESVHLRHIITRHSGSRVVGD